MKKKGLIISTIVMVVVLIASLTTATYAWFNATGSATVSGVTLSTTAAADILIGVEKDNAYDSTANPNNFYSESTTFEYPLSTQTTVWEGATNGLGLNVTHTVSLADLDQALYSFTGAGTTESPYVMDDYTKGSGQAVTDHIIMTGSGHVLKTANGTGAGAAFTTTGMEDAVVNSDYLNIAFGAAPGKSDVMAYGCLVLVHPTDSLSSLGINAAIHVAYSIDGGSWTDLDAYGDSRYNTAKTGTGGHGTPAMPSITVTGSKAGTYTYQGVTPAAGDALVWIPLAQNLDSTYLTPNVMKQIQLVIYVCGPDSDCITSAMGVSAEISINFISVNGRQPADVNP
jgi:hypothetical protein